MNDLVTMIRLTVQIHDRWAVGGVPDPAKPAEVDLPVLIDPRMATGAGFTPYLPGTSLAGSLKAHLRDRKSGPYAVSWLGPDPGPLERRTDQLDLTPSRLWLLGTRHLEDSRVWSRGTTKVDGHRAAAQGGSLRTEQWATPVKMAVLMQHDGAVDQELLDLLAGWRPVIGRSRSTGMGFASATDVYAVTLDLTQEEHLGWWLSGRQEWLHNDGPLPASVRPVLRQASSPGSVGEERVFKWRVREPLHVGVEEPSAETDDGTEQEAASVGTVARTFTIDGRSFADGGRPAIPGSSWKGLFRHRVRSILIAVGELESEVEKVCNAVFGSLEDGRGRLRFGDSPVLTGGSRLRRTHVAIDRFTGGARDGGLFSVEAVEEGATLDLQISCPAGPFGPATLAILNHVARDVHDGLIGVGGHVTRGYGWLELRDPSLVRSLPPVDARALREESGVAQ